MHLILFIASSSCVGSNFGAFCPVFRLHGKRLGGPPADECGTTNGDNEVWSFGDPATACISSVMALRESLRPYVSQLSAEASQTGYAHAPPCSCWPFPMTLQASQPWSEGSFMLGADWLVSPVTAYGATSWTVYLPLLPSGETWVYHFNASVSFPGGDNVTIATPLDEFPLFLRSNVTSIVE